MKHRGFYFVLFIILFISLSGCSENSLPPDELMKTDQVITQTEEAQIIQRTDTFETAVSEMMTDVAPPTFTFTPTFTDTPQPTDTPEIQPTSENPWMLQAACEWDKSCMKLEIRNKTDSWVQVELTKTDTGDAGFFSVKPKSTAVITMMLGKYRVRYVYYCGNIARVVNNYLLSRDRSVTFRCN